MPSSTEKPRNNKKDSELYDVIYAKVTKKTHNHESPKKNGDGTLKKCIKLFKEEADPNVLSELEKSLIERIESEKSPKKREKYYKYYIENFLPALKTEVIESTELSVPAVLNSEIEQSQRPQTIKGKILGIISEITSRSSNKNLKTEEQPINSVKEEIPVSATQMIEDNAGSIMTPTQLELDSLTKEEVCASGSDSGMDSPGLSATSTSSEESLDSTSSVVEGNNDLQKEETENQMQLEQTVTEELRVQENESPSVQADLGQVKEELSLNGEESEPALLAEEEPKLEEKEKKAVLNKQKFSANRNDNKDIPPKKQSHIHIALVAGCALLAIGCIVAGAMTSGLIGAGLFVMAAVFATAAAAEFHSNFLSSKLTSINVSPLVDDKELTTYSKR